MRKFLSRLTFFSLLFTLPWQSTPAQNDGFVKITTPLPVGRAFHGSAVMGDYIYVFGGSVTAPNQETAKAAFVNVARISQTGQLSRWIETTSITNPRHYIENSSIVYNDTVYVLGGSTEALNGTRLNTIMWTRPNPNGLLQQWRESEPFTDAGLSCTASFATPGFIHLTGGLSGDAQVSQRVWSIRVNPDGSLGEWEAGPPLPRPLWFH